MAQRMHRGSVLGFVLVGVLLLALVAGGIYLVRHQLTATTSPTTGSEASDNAAAPDKPSETADSSTKPDETTTKETKSDLEQALQSQSEAEKKAQAQKEAQEREAAQSAPVQPSSTAELPATGPADTLITLLGAALLAGTAFAYIRSRALI